jgi:60 kDa SS-A/Ro ribonucleoprotein
MSSVYSDFAASMSPKAQASAVTTVTKAIPGREAEMASNNGGGVSFLLDNWGVYDRFLMLGSESAGYYVGQKETTKQSFEVVKACIKEDGLRAVSRAVEFSLAGRAPKNDPAVVALALAAVFGNEGTIEAAYDALPRVARTGTWLFLFVSILDSMGKWNAAAKRGVSKWYTSKNVDRLAVQLLKYQQRNGWAHRDVLRLAHVKPTSDVQSNLFRYSIKGELDQGAMVPQILIDFETLKRTDSKTEVLRIVEANSDITWEMVGTQFLKDKDVLSALVKNMGLTATIRKLGTLTANGVISPLSQGSKDVIAKLSDIEQLRKQRVHPITLLQAFKQYSMGRGEKGSTIWTPDQRVLDALDEAFYAAFGTIEKTDENYFVGVDCSGSMQGAMVNGSPNLTAIEVAGVMALAVIKNQPNFWIGGFNSKMGELKITPKMRLDEVTKTMLRFSWGSTNISACATHALENKIPVDKIIIITDNEVNGGIHPTQALRNYRNGMSSPGTAQVVIATSMSNFTVADPKDSLQMDVAGFDSACPQIIAQFGVSN